MHQLQELVRLHRMGSGAREVARLLGISPNTERRYRQALDAAELLGGPVEELPELAVLRSAVECARPRSVGAQEVSTAQPWAERVSEMIGKGAQPKAIYDTLRREVADFDASYWAVKRLCKRLREAKGVRAEDVAIRVVTEPGKQAQVDFGYVGRLYDPERGVVRKAWVFVMTLSHSRHAFCRVVFDQSCETWIDLHIEAFAAFGGVPEEIRPDNLKAAVIRAAFGTEGEPALNRSYRELARYYGFKVDPTPARQPKKKGKVERAVRYVKSNFFAPLVDDFEDIHDANRRLDDWVQRTAGLRTHGTTGWQPLVEFETVEKPALRPLPARPYGPVTWKRAKVHQDCHFLFERRTYPVPWRFIGKEVWVRAVSGSLEDFDFAFNPEIPKAAIIDLATLLFMDRHENVLLIGPSGVGKSHVGQALGERACRRGKTVLFVQAHKMFTDLRAARADRSYERRMLRYTGPDLLIIDDLGLRPLQHDEPVDLHEIIRQRYRRGSMVITSNRDVEEWYPLFGDALLASAAMDRLLHDAHVVKMKGESYRNPPTGRRSA